MKRVHALSWSPNGRWLACCGAGDEVRIWDAFQRAVVRTLQTARPGARSVSWSPDGKLLACGQGDWAESGKGHVQVWSAASGDELWAAGEKAYGAYSVCFSSDGQRLASGHGSGVVNVWDAGSGQQVFAVAVEDNIRNLINGVCFDPNGKFIVFGTCYEDRLFVYGAGGDEKHALTYTKHTTWVDFEHPIRFSPDGQWLARGSQDGWIRIWGTRGFFLTDIQIGHDAPAYAISWGSDGRCLASGSRDGEIAVWDLQTQEKVCSMTHRPLHAVCYDPLGSLLASGGDDAAVCIWDVAPESASFGQCLTKFE